MRLPAEKIKNEIDHKQKIINILIASRRKLELQMASFGEQYVPPFIMQQINDYANQIAQKEQEVAQLRTQLVETTLPVNEVEYRVLVAEAWSRSSGWLSVLDESRLELERLRLGITEDKSNEHHSAVRSRLAFEILLDLELNNIQEELKIRSDAVKRIIRAFRLDPLKAEKFIQLNIDRKNVEILIEWLKETRTVWQSKEEYANVDSFFQKLLKSKQNFDNTQKSIKTPQSWKGVYRYNNSSRETSMTLTIEQASNLEFSGKAKYSALENTITQVVGEIIQQNNSDISEVNRWQYIPVYSSMESEDTLMRFTETDYIQGHQAQLHGWYYGVLRKNGEIVGIWFPADTELYPQDRSSSKAI